MPAYKIARENPIYRRAVKREGKFWKGQSDDPANPTHLPKPLVAYKREKETGDSATDRFTHLRKLGPFKKGLSIGCGSANVERILLRRGIVQGFTFIDISEESLRALTASLSPALRRRVHIETQDLNFIELEENAYDFIFCANVLHHVVNLEHLLLELNKALTDNGILYIDDFIGESRFQFSDARIAKINATAKAASAKTGIPWVPMERTSRSSLINSCPFEAVRSDELLGLLRKIFGKHTVFERTYGAISSWMGVVMPFARNRGVVMDTAADLFVAADRRSRLPPLFVFAAYRKNPRPPRPHVRAWTKREITHHLPVRRVDERYAVGLGTFVRKALGERVHHAAKRLYFRLRR